MLTQIQAMNLALEGDKVAIMTIIAHQSQGRWLRLYPHGRKGPLDEGYIVFLYGMALDKIFITTGKPVDRFVIDKALAATILKTTHQLMTDLNARFQGQAFDDMRSEMLRGRTKGLTISCIPENDKITLVLSPKARLWSLSYNDARQLAWKVLDACEALDWSLNEVGASDIAGELRDF
jgi:hypothetical protein